MIHRLLSLSLLFIVGIFGLISGPIACKTASSVAEKVAAQLPTRENAESDALSAYIACYNRTMPTIDKSIERYYSWVDRKTGPTCKEEQIYSLYEIPEDSLPLCKKALSTGSSDLDKTGKTYIEIHAALTPLIKKMLNYYSLEKYREDQCSGAQALDKEFSALVAQYEKARDDFSAVIDREKTALDAKTLKKMEATQGKNIDWHIQNYVMTAKTFVETGIVQNEDGSVQKAPYLAAFATFEPAYLALEAYGAANGDELKKRELDQIVTISANNIYRAARLIKLDFAEGKTPKDTQFEGLINSYNGFIDALNFHAKFH